MVLQLTTKKLQNIREFATNNSVVVIMLVFLAILLFQLKRKINTSALTKCCRPVVESHIDDLELPVSDVSVPTRSVVELEEHNQLRESLLDSD